jgi:hypothetical protein
MPYLCVLDMLILVFGTFITLAKCPTTIYFKCSFHSLGRSNSDILLFRPPRRKLLPRKPPPRRLQRRKLRSLLLLLLLPPPLVPPLPAPAGRESVRRLWSWGRRRVPSLRGRYEYVVFLEYLTLTPLCICCLFVCPFV